MMSWLNIKYDSKMVEYHAPFGKAMPGDAGFDLYNASGEILTIAPYKYLTIPAGISIKLPDGHCALVRSRSSTFGKRGLFVVPGLIDCGYTGPILTIVWHPNINEINRPILIKPWERLSQLVILPIPEVKVQVVDELPGTPRGSRGFGSTGR